LPADFETQINPTGNEFQSFRHHPALLPEASVNFGCGAFFETLDDHVKHDPSVVAGVPPAIFNSAANTAATTANLSDGWANRPDQLFQLFIHFRESLRSE